jgi:putative hemolysin
VRRHRGAAVIAVAPPPGIVTIRGVNRTLDIGNHIPLILTVIVLLLFSAFFSGSETAFFSLSRFMVIEMEKGDGRKRMIPRLLDEPRKLLVTILFGNLLVNIAATSAVTALAIALFGESGVGIAVIVMTILILIFGEISPKSLAMRNAAAFAVTAAPLLRFFYLAFIPVRYVLGYIADGAVERSRRLFGERRSVYVAQELATAVDIGYKEGVFSTFEKEVLTNLFLLAETTIREILTPRVEVFSLGVDTPLKEAVIAVRSRGFSRIPLFEEHDGNIVGVLLAKDILRYPRDERGTVGNIMRKVRYAPESKKIRGLFGELITAQEHMVIALDEHGSFTGIVTLEDILEELFGEIRDRREPKVEDYLMPDEDHLIVEGTMRLEDINELFDTGLESKEVETIAGYLIEGVGKVPREGESFIIGELRFLVLSAEPTKVNKIKLERIAAEEKGDGHA